MTKEELEIHIESLRTSNKKLHSDLEIIETELEDNNKQIFLYELFKELDWLRNNLTNEQKDRLRKTEYNYFTSSIYDIINNKNRWENDYDDIYPRIYNYSPDDGGFGIDWRFGLIMGDDSYCFYSVLDIFEATHDEISDNSVNELIDYILGTIDKFSLILK